MSEKKILSRSEIVRLRRQAQLRQQLRPQNKKSRVKRNSSYRELPPITTRGVVNDFAIERRKITGKRRYNAILSMSSPKSRVKGLPKIRIRIGWRLLSFFLVLLFGTGLNLFLTQPQFRVNSAKVIGNQRISADEINSVLELDGYPIFLLKPDYIKEQTLRNYPELASVEVTVSLPNIVTVIVAERQPIILWQQESGYTWVDETGTAIRPRGEARDLIIVQASGEPSSGSVLEGESIIPTSFIPEETVKAITTLAPHVPPGTHLSYDPDIGLNWADGRGWQVVFGISGHNNDVKLLVYQSMVEWLSQRSIRPLLINVAYPRAPFYRMEPVEGQAEE